MNAQNVRDYLLSLVDPRVLAAADATATELGWETAARTDPVTGAGYVSNPGRLHLVAGLMAQYQARTLLEVGAGRGYTALGCVLVGRRLGRAFQVVTLDVIPANQRQRWEILRPARHQCETEQRSLADVIDAYGCSEAITVLPGPSRASLRQLDNRFKIAYIDGAHSLFCVACDLLLCMQRLEANGVVVMDDFGGQQGRSTKWLVTLLHLIKLVNATEIEMSLQADERLPEVELGHHMVVVTPASHLSAFLSTRVGVRFGSFLCALAAVEEMWTRQKVQLKTLLVRGRR